MKLTQTLSVTTLTVVAFLLNLLLPVNTLTAEAHGFLHKPASRNKIRDTTGCPHCLSAGGPGKVFSSQQYRHGMCGNAYDDQLQHWNQPGEVQATYTEGQAIEVEMAITAHHVGYFDFQLCDSQDISEECFFRNRLMRNGCTDENDVNCFRVWKHLTSYETHLWVATKSSPAYDGPAVDVRTTQTVTYKARLQLPQGIKCSHCVLRWHYYTTNSCTNPGNPTQVSEEFFNCADIRINAKSGGSGATPNTSLGSSSGGSLNGLLYHKPQNLYYRGSNMYYFCPREHNSRAIGFRENYNLPNSQSCYSVGVGASCSIGDDDVPSNDNDYNNNDDNSDNNDNDGNNDNDFSNDNNNNDSNNNNDFSSSNPTSNTQCGSTCTRGCMWSFSGSKYCYSDWDYSTCNLYMPTGPYPPSENDSYYQWCGDGSNSNNNDNDNNDSNTSNNNNNNDTNNNDNDGTDTNVGGNDVCSKNRDCSGCVWTLSNGDSYCYPNWAEDVCQLYTPQGYTWCGN